MSLSLLPPPQPLSLSVLNESLSLAEPLSVSEESFALSFPTWCAPLSNFGDTLAVAFAALVVVI